MHNEHFNYGIIILAAGSSSRLGTPKQLLRFQESSLLELVIKRAQAVSKAKTIVVTGANKALFINLLENIGVNSCHNEKWSEGMASSIKTGLKALLALEPALQACIITVCDQPYLSQGLFESLILKHDKDKCSVVACSYGNTIGTPVLFDERYFKDLMLLEGQEGAKILLNKYETNVCLLPFSKGEIDIDTKEDYVKLISAENPSERTDIIKQI